MFLTTKTNGWLAVNSREGIGSAHLNNMTAAGNEGERLIKFDRSQWHSETINATYSKMAAATGDLS
jgi:hypothetical protein